MTSSESQWESLDPWEKAAQWREVAPEITNDLITLAKAKAIQASREQIRRAEEEAIAAKFEREMRRDDARHRQEAEKMQAERDHEIRAEQIKQSGRMIKRLWMLQLIAMIGGVVSIVAIVVAAIFFASNGDPLAGAGIFTLGGALVAGIYGTNRSVTRRLREIATEQQRQAALVQGNGRQDGEAGQVQEVGGNTECDGRETSVGSSADTGPT